MLAPVAGIIFTAGWPGWVDSPRSGSGASAGGAFPYIVASPTRLVVVMLIALVFLWTVRAAFRR